MTVYQVLEGEYGRITTLFERLRNTSGRIGAPRQRLLQLLSRELTALVQAEEEVLYFALQEVLPPDDGRIFDLMEDHADLRGSLWELEQTAVDDPRWITRLEATAELARHHVKVEETVAFEPARALLAEETSVTLGQRLVARKAEIEMHAIEIESRAGRNPVARLERNLLN